MQLTTRCINAIFFAFLSLRFSYYFGMMKKKLIWITSMYYYDLIKSMGSIFHIFSHNAKIIRKMQKRNDEKNVQKFFGSLRFEHKRRYKSKLLPIKPQSGISFLTECGITFTWNPKMQIFQKISEFLENYENVLGNSENSRIFLYISI